MMLPPTITTSFFFTKMTLYEILQKNADRMLYSIFGCDDRFFIVSPFKDAHGRYRESYTETTIKDAEYSLGAYRGTTEDNWAERESNGWRYIGLWHPPMPKPYKPGDLVDLPDTEEVRAYISGVYEDYLEISCRHLDNLVGKKGLKIVRQDNAYFSRTDGGEEELDIPSHLLIPHIPKDEEQVISSSDVEDGMFITVGQKKYKVVEVEV